MKRPLPILIGCVSLALAAAAVYVYWFRAEDIQAKVQTCDEFLQAFEEIGKFNGTVLVAKNGEVILRKGYGIRNAQLNLVHEPDSIFRIYSITKPFTSTVVLRLAEQDKLSLSDPISKYFPELPNADEVTVEHLLTHTSGYYEFTREADFINTEPALLNLLKERPVDFMPGQGWSYCNSGYCLLGHIIAKVSDSTYEEAVAKHILKPLGMAETGFRFNDLQDPRKAIGYGTFSDSEKIEAIMDDDGGPFAAGAIYSTVDDLWLFQQALNDGRLLSNRSRVKAWEGCSQNNGYGYGWQLGSRWIMRSVISHSGGASGFRSNLSQVPRSEYCVILLNNHELADVEYITDRIYDILDGQDIAIPREEAKPSPEDLEALVGFFEPDDKHGVIRTYIVDGRLAVDFLGRAQGTMIAKGNDRFVQFESDADVQFVRDEHGECVGLIAKQDRMTIEARKYEGAWGIPESTEETLNQVLEATPKTSPQWHEAAFKLAHFYAFENQHDRHKELCRIILDNHGGTDSPQIAERTTKACFVSQLAPFSDEVGTLADRAYAKRDSAGTFDWGGQVHWRDYLAVAKGMADVRRGDHESAIAALESATKFSRYDEHSLCVRDLLLAVSYQHAGQPKLANERFAAATAVIQSLPESYADREWNDRILIDVLQHEAEDAISIQPMRR